MRRRPAEGMLGGVCAGVAERTGIDVNAVRVGLVLVGLASGIGAAGYGLAWLFVPVDGADEAVGRRALGDGRGLAIAAALLPLVAIVLLLASALGAGWLGALVWPGMVTTAALVLVWRNGTPEDRIALRRAGQPIAAAAAASGGSRRRLVVRSTAGLVLVLAGVAILAGERRRIAPLVPLGAVTLVVAGIVLVFGPWWVRLGRDLMVERQARIRAEERADMAARVHDSVLQSLALIQRAAGDPQRVAQLARAQERELRAWLFEGHRPGDLGGVASTLAGAVAVIQAEVEAAHGIQVETVVVGDTPLAGPVEALLAASREATVNAARWSGSPTVSLFAEVEADRVSLFVRDRGCGFDLDALGDDRRGVRESIRGRMDRCGGRATIRTAPGAGTEVELSVPLGDRSGAPR